MERLERTNIVPQKVDSSTKSTFVSNQTQDSMYEKKLNFKQDIDVRGMRGDEALQAVTYFIDDAILVGMSRRTYSSRNRHGHFTYTYSPVPANSSRYQTLCR